MAVSSPMTELRDRASPMAPSQNQTRKRPLPRIKWACDHCRRARSRCDGHNPCARCKEYARHCAYERKPKSRGRPPLKSANKNVRESPPSQPSNSVRTATTSPRLVSPQRDSHWDPLETFPIAADNLGTMTFEPAGITVSLAGSSLPSGASMCPVSQSDIAFGVEMGNAMGIRSDGDAAALSQSFHNTLDLLELDTARPTASRTEAGSEDAELSPGLTTADSVPEPWEGTAARESFIGCPYTVLQPILPYICHMIPPDVACEMLNYFFNDPGVAIFQTQSPYNLATLFRRSSFLRMKEPRSTSSALLAAILFVCAQTCDEKTFQNRSHIRARICDELLAITIRLLGHAAPTTRSGTPACPSLSQARPTGDCEKIEAWLTLDNVIACILCGIVLSGSDNKSNCLMWFDRARMMALMLELNREQTNPSAQQEAFIYSKELIAQEERKEERRRTWWLLYAMDRHLALCYNAPLHLLDSKCQVFQPLGDEEWQQLDVHLAVAQSPQRPFGPPSRVSGLGFFQFFLPFMVVLGDVVSLHHFRLNSRYAPFVYRPFETVVESSLQQLRDSVAYLSGDTDISRGNSHPPKLFERGGSINTTQIVASYSAFLVHTLAILTFGDWDIITMLRNGSPTLHGDNATKFFHHTVLASQAMKSILDCDPELTYMPYLLGIYILQVGFAVLVVAENIGSQASSELQEAIETFIRAHESCIATLDTKYQRDFRKALIGTLSIMKGMTGCHLAGHQARRHEILSMYRWDDDGTGLLLT